MKAIEIRDDFDADWWSEAHAAAGLSLPYDRMEYLDALGVTWMAAVAGNFILPFAIARSKWGYQNIFCPLGAQRLGPIGFEAGDPMKLRAVLDALPKVFRLRLATCMPQGWPQDRGWHFRQGGLERWRAAPNFELELGSSYAEVYGSYASQTRRNLKSAKGNQLWEYSNPEELWRYFAANQGPKYRPPKGYERAMKSAMYHLMHQGRGAVWAALGPGNEWLAGIFVAFSGDRAVLLFSAVTPEGRARHSMTWLVNEFLTMAVGRWKVFDFEGSDAPGLARFYQGFGAKNVPYLRWERWNFPWQLP